jgi:hypothetical protein
MGVVVTDCCIWCWSIDVHPTFVRLLFDIHHTSVRMSYNSAVLTSCCLIVLLFHSTFVWPSFDFYWHPSDLCSASIDVHSSPFIPIDALYFSNCTLH